MAYIPTPPPARNRNGRSPMPHVRPSGDALSGILIDNIPAGARVFVDGTEIPTIGGRRVPFDGRGNVLRVQTADGMQVRETDQTGYGGFGAGDNFDWNTMTPVAVADDAPPTALRVTRMPRGGRVIVNGAEVGGRWVDAAETLWEVPLSSPVISSLTIEDVDGNARSRRRADQVTVQRGVAYVNWDALRIPDGTLRVFGAPHVGVILDGRLLAPASGGTGISLYTLPEGEHTLRITAEDGFVWTPTVRITGGQITQLPLVRPYVAPPPVVGAGVGGASPSPETRSTLTINGFPGFVVALATAAAPTTPLPGTPVPIPASGTSGAVPVPPGNYVLGVANYGGALQTRPLAIAPGANVVVNVNDYFPRAQLTVSGTPGLRVAIAAVGSAQPLLPIATIPASGAISVPWQEGRYDLGVSDGTRVVKRTIVVPPAGFAVDVRDWLAPAAGGAGTGAGAGPAATPGNLTVTGGVGWVLTLTPAGASEFINRQPILAGGTVALPVAAGVYSLKVDDGAGHTAAQSITVGAAGASVDVTPWLASARSATQGSSAPGAATGTVRLVGAPPRSVVRVAGLADYAVDDTGRPVALHLPAGDHAVTVIPPSGAPRVGRATVAAGASSELLFGSMPAPAAVTDTGMQPAVPVEQMCGPIANAPAWAPPTACPGQVLTAPDGTRYAVALAPAGQTGVVITQLKADGTPVDAGWSAGTMLLVGGLVVAAGAAWWFYGRDTDSKVENPGKAKCACQKH